MNNSKAKVVKRNTHRVISTNQQAQRLAAKPRTVYVYFMIGCPHCEAMKPAWEQAKKNSKGKSTVEIERRFVPHLNANLNEVRGFPTIFAFDDKMNKVAFDSFRTVDNLTDFVNRYG